MYGYICKQDAHIKGSGSTQCTINPPSVAVVTAVPLLAPPTRTAAAPIINQYHSPSNITLLIDKTPQHQSSRSSHVEKLQDVMAFDW
jgi:hypothetical protein